MKKVKEVSSLAGIIVIIIVAVILLGGVFTYQYVAISKRQIWYQASLQMQVNSIMHK